MKVKVVETIVEDFSGMAAVDMLPAPLWQKLIQYFEIRNSSRQQLGEPNNFKELTREVSQLTKEYPNLALAYLEWLTIKTKIEQSGSDGAILEISKISRFK